MGTRSPSKRMIGVHLKPWIITAALISSMSTTLAIEAPEGIVYCHGKTTVEFAFDRSNSNNDVNLVVNGKSQKALTAYSWFGAVQAPPKGFKFAILGKGDFDPLLVFDGYLLDAKKRKYTKCN